MYIGDHNKMENTTTRLAVKISNLPDGEISWEDSTPQGLRKDLTEEDVLANEEDGQILYERMVKYVCSFVTREFDDLSELRVFTDESDSTRTPRMNPSVVVPMKILFHDEKYTGENIQILQKLAKEAKITGNPQVSAVTPQQCTTLMTDILF